MANKTNLLSLFSFLLSLSMEMKAQPGYQLPFLQEIGTSVNVRPSQLPDNDYYFSLPVLPVLDVQFTNSGLDYKSARTLTDQGTYIDLNRLIANVKPRNTIGLQTTIDLFNFGMKTGRGYFSISISHRAGFNFIYTDDFMNLLFRGNGPYIGQTIDLSHCGFDASRFWDIGAGYTTKINDYITAGIRVKRLIGLDNISTDIQSLTATTRSNDYTLQLSSSSIVNTCSPFLDNANGQTNSNGSSAVFDYIKGRGNGGWGLNFGLAYSVTPKLTCSFDALDIGKINWKSEPVNYRLDKGNYTFSGISLNQLLHQNADSADYVDSLSHSFPSTETRQAYSTSLPATMMLSSNYEFTKTTSGVFSLRGVFFQHQFLPSMNLMLKQSVGNVLTFSVNYAYRYDRIGEFGVGASCHAGPLSIFIVTDNLFGSFYPLRSKSASVYAGLLFSQTAHKSKKR